MSETPTYKQHEDAIKELLGTLNGEIEKRFDERDTDLAQKVKNALDELVPQAVAQYAKENPSFSLPGCNEEKGHKFEYARALDAIRKKNPDLAPYEFECFKEMQKQYGEAWLAAQTKDAAVAPNTGYIASQDGLAGPHLVPEEHFNEIIDLFYANSVAFQLGARSMPNMFGTCTIPVLLSGASAAWSYENTAIAETDPTFGEHTMRPRRLAAAVRVSNMLLSNSRPMAEDVIRENLMEQFRVALDTAILTGSGSGANPTGLLNATPLMSGELASGAVTIGTAWTYKEAMEFITDLANVNALKGSLGWAMNPTDWSNAVQMTSGTTNVDVNRLVVQDGAATRLLGYPIATTTILAHSGGTSLDETVIFGDWSQIRVPFWKTMELRTTDVGADTFLRDQTLVRGIMYADVSVDHLEAFSIGSTYA